MVFVILALILAIASSVITMIEPDKAGEIANVMSDGLLAGIDLGALNGYIEEAYSGQEVIEIKSVADKIVVEKKTKTASYSLESLEVGDYELRIRAVADERKNSSLR